MFNVRLEVDHCFERQLVQVMEEPNEDTQLDEISNSQKLKKTTKLNAFRCLFDLDLIPYKLFCFFLYGAYGSLLPYLPLYFKQLGIQAFEAGVIIGIRPMVQIIGAPFFGALADRFRMGKVLLFGGVGGWICKALLLLTVRPHNQKCISLYENTTGNVKFTQINVVSLWGKQAKDRGVWSLITDNKTVLVEKPNMLPLYSLREQQQVKHKKQNNSKLLYELKKKDLYDRETYKFGGKSKRVLDTSISEDFSFDKLISKKNLSLFEAKAENYDSTTSYQAERKKTYIVEAHTEKIRRIRKAILLKRPVNIKPRCKRFIAEENITSLLPKPEQWQSFQAKLKKLGLVVSQIARSFEPKLNVTVTYVTQIDAYEVYFMFVIFTFLIILGEFLESPTYTLSDASLLDRLGEDREYYGNIRMFGSLGWALASLFVGYLVAATELNLCGVRSGNYLVTFYVFIGCCVVAFFCVFGFTFKYDNKKQSRPSCRDFGQLLLNLRFSSFLISALFVGWCYGFLIHFVNWFIDDLHGSSFIMGVAGAAREVTGLFFFFIGGNVISVLGHLNTIVLCLLAYMVLFSCYSIVVDPWFVVGLEMMAGANYAMAWSTCVNYMNRVGSALGVTSTIQGKSETFFLGKDSN